MQNSPFMQFMFYYLEPISFFLPIPFLIYHSAFDKRARIKVLAAYYFIGMLLMLKANTLNLDLSNNINDYRLFNLSTGLFICMYFYSSLLAVWKKRIVLFFGFSIIIQYLINFITVPNPQSFDSYGSVTVSLIIVILVLFFMHQTISNVTEEPLSSNFDFWFVVTQMIYHSGSFIILLTYGYFTKKILDPNQYTQENRHILMELWNANTILILISSLILCASILWINMMKSQKMEA